MFLTNVVSILFFVLDQNGYCQPHARPSATHKLQNKNNKKNLRWQNTGNIESNTQDQMCLTAREELFEILSFIQKLKLRCAV